MTKTTAKLFMHGRSQAVRLPKEFRMPGKEVEIARDGENVTLIPMKKMKLDHKKILAELAAMELLENFAEDRYQGLKAYEPPDLGE